MRRTDKEVADRHLIDQTIRGSLACRVALAKDNAPYVVPMSFGYDGAAIYLHTAPAGKKIEYFAANPQVCFEFDRHVELRSNPESACKWTLGFESVIGYGTIRELLEPAEKEHGLNEVMRQYSGKTWPFESASLAKVRLWKITITSLTGKRSPPTPSCRCGEQPAQGKEVAIREGLTAMDFSRVHAWLAATYWTPGILRERVENAARNSALVIGAFAPDGTQLGYARVVSDKTRFAYLCDVVVDEAHRRRGIARTMARFALGHPEFATVGVWTLATRDAHGVYGSLGFLPVSDPLSRPADWMVLRRRPCPAPAPPVADQQRGIQSMNGLEGLSIELISAPIDAKFGKDLLDAWNRSVLHENMDETWFRDEILLPPGTSGAVHLALCAGGIVGFASLRRQTLRGIFVVPEWRRRGIGTRLLASVIENVVANGGRRLGVETNNYWCVVPGIDVRHQSAIAFCLKRGFRKTAGITDMWLEPGNPLRSPFQADAIRRTNEAGIRVAPYRPADLDALRAFVAAFGMEMWFPAGWESRYEFPGKQFVALRGDKIVGFVEFVVSPNRTGGINYIGVLPAVRKTGVGSCLLMTAVAQMRVEGATGILASWAPAPFYFANGWHICREYAALEWTGGQ